MKTNRRERQKRIMAKKLIKELSKRLKADFGKGFDPSNLWHMRSFFLAFPILDAVRRELTWTHYRLLLKVENYNSRSFYLNEAAEANWSTHQLERQINSFFGGGVEEGVGEGEEVNRD